MRRELLRYVNLLAAFVVAPLLGEAKQVPTNLSAFGDTTYYWISLCPGVSSVMYEGEELALGSVTHFHFTSSQGEDSVAQINVITAPEVVFWATTEPICYGSKNGHIEFWNHASLTEPFEFSIDGGASFHNDYFFDGLGAGYYKIAAKDRLGCIYEKDITIVESLPMRLETPREVITCQDSVQLSFKVGGPPMAYNWTWQFGSETSSDSIIWASTEGSYDLTVVNECDTIKRQVVVKMESSPSKPQLYVPNAFSPNGDGINDCLQAFLSPNTQLLDFQFFVFDRWGGEVFSTKDLDGCWDGTWQGKELQPGVFAWQVVANYRNCFGQKSQLVGKGDIAVLR